MFLVVDEISYGRPRKFLTVIVDHETGQVVWAAEGRTPRLFASHFNSLTATEREAVEVITMDMSAAFKKAVEESVPKAVIRRFIELRVTNAPVEGYNSASAGVARSLTGRCLAVSRRGPSRAALARVR
ncbi:MAG: transposase [Thermoanaerobaculia bacterium]